MKTLVIFCATLLFSSGLFAQKFIEEWNRDYPIYENYGGINSIFPTTDGNLLTAGGCVINNVGTMFFMKTDTAGNPIWTTYAEEQFNSHSQFANRIIQDNEGNYVIIGTYNPGFSWNTYFTKLSPDGTILSTHVNGGEHDYQGGHDIVQTMDSGYLVSAQKYEYSYGGMCFAVRKLDSDGSFLWDTTFVHPEDSTSILGNFGRMAKINDTTFVLTGDCDYAAGSFEDFDIIQAKIRVYKDSVQMLRLSIYELDGANERGYDILILPNDVGFIMCGEGDNENNPGAKVGVIMRTDTAGNQIWKKTYTRALNSNTSFIRVLLDDDENILVMARTSAGSNDVTLLKYSTDGELLQKKHFDNGWNETAYSMALDQDRKIYLGEWHTSYSGVSTAMYKVKDICPLITPEAALADSILIPGSDVVVSVANSNDAWQYSLIQISGEINLGTFMGNGETLDFTASGLSNANVLDGLVVSVIEPDVDCIKYSDTLFPEFIDGIEDIYQNSLKIMPNPTHVQLTITDIKHQLSSLAVYNLNGKLIIKKNDLSEYNQLNISALPAGIYLFWLTYDNGISVYRKVIKN